MSHLQILFILLAIACIFSSPFVEGFSNLYFAKPTKCVDCQRELPEGKKYMGTPSKCFDCEKEYQKRGLEADWGQNTKCFNCESQLASRN